MTVYLVGAGPGDPGLLTVRGAEVLSRADVVVYDRLSAASLLHLAPAAAELISVGKTPHGPSRPQAEINAMLIEYGKAGRTVVRLKGGDPFVFARGGEEAAALLDAGVLFEVVPGVSAAFAVPAYAGVPVTHRGLATSFTVVTGHEDPWAATDTDWSAVARVGGTIVVFMGAATRAEIAKRLIDGGLGAQTPVAAVQWGTRPEQRTVRTTLASLGDAEVSAPAVIVIGAVAALDLSWFERRPLFGRRVVVTRAGRAASPLVDRLTALGAEVLLVPTIAVAEAQDGGESLRSAARQIATYDWVVFTSRPAVERLSACIRDARVFGSARIAAVGPGTAAALTAMGLVADLVPARSVGEALVDAFPDGHGRVLLPQSADARRVVADGLIAKGWSVERVEAYSTETIAPSEETLAEVGKADAITFTSASTVRGFVDGGGASAISGAVICIGPVTADAAAAAGLEVTAVADPHTIDGLVAAVLRSLS